MLAVILVCASVALATSTDRPIGPFPKIIDGKFHDLARPYFADVNVDCHIKMAAYDFAKEIQPERGNLRTVFDALQLQQCGMKRPEEDKPLPIPEVENPGFTVFVDIVHGNDGNDGKIDTPVKTIERGLAILRGMQGRRTLYLREGTYYVPKPILLTKIDDDLVISSYNNEKVTLSGAKEVEVEWKPYRVGEFDRFENKNVVFDIKPNPAGDVKDRVRFLGKVPTADDCQKK